MPSAKQTLAKLSTRRRAPVDLHAANDLELFVENTGELHPMKLAIGEQIKKKIRNGTYDPSKAPKAWLYWVDAGARRYMKEFHMSGTIDTAFNKPTREHVAAEFARQFEGEIRRGEWD